MKAWVKGRKQENSDILRFSGLKETTAKESRIKTQPGGKEQIKVMGLNCPPTNLFNWTKCLVEKDQGHGSTEADEPKFL